ncbi:MAG: GTP-binding protein [Planctomycetes bacterium]|nr:GTP-binding protein [Planctomycetota bacterium]
MRTPVILLSGFLGAGKTTLLTRLIPAAHRAGIKAAVLMNESGAVSIDGPVAQGAGIDVVDVLGGCVCCELKGELHAALKEILDRFSPQLVIVETTGIADPLEVVDACTATDLVMRLDPRGVVTVVDAAHGSAALQINELARRQVELADILIVNKVDLAKPDSLVPLWMELKAANPRAEIIETTQANVDADKLLAGLMDVARPPRPRADAAPAPHHHHGNRHGYLALSYRVQPAQSKQALLEILRGLPSNVVRAKGFLRLVGDERLYICQLAGGYAQASVFPLAGFDPEPVLVVIGKALDRAAVEAVLAPLMPEEL